MTGERGIAVFFPVSAIAENLHPLHPHPLDLSTWGQEDAVWSLGLSCTWCVWLRKVTELKGLFKTCPLPKASYLLEKPFIPNVCNISHNDTFPCSFVWICHTSACLWQPSWTRLLLLIAWMLWVLCSQVDVEKIFWLNYKSSPHELLMLSKNILNSCDLEFH